jgi:hypothetical protein
MELTQTVPSPLDVPVHLLKAEAAPAALLLATIWIELKPERVQEPQLAAGEGETVSLSLQLMIHQSQTVTFGLSGSELAITFNGEAA